MQTVSNELSKSKMSFFFIAFIALAIIAIITERQYRTIHEIKKVYDIDKKVENASKLIQKVSETKNEQNDSPNSESESDFVKKQSKIIKSSLNDGKNSVTIKNQKGYIRYDLDGKTHGNIVTPHKHIYKYNLKGAEIRNVSEISESPVPVTKNDIELIKSYLERLKK